jgi:hypothetical protein
MILESEGVNIIQGNDEVYFGDEVSRRRRVKKW